METKFTAGPWKYSWRQVDGEADCGVFAEPHEGQAYSVCRAPLYQTEEQWDADARLIAAAPELLAALIGAVEMATNAHVYWDADQDIKVGKHLLALSGGLKGYDARTDAIHAAIAKATGSQP